MIRHVDNNNPQELWEIWGTALVVCLSHTNEYKRQLKNIIEISNLFAGTLEIFIIITGPSKNLMFVGGNEVRVYGTPTFLLLHNGKEQARFLGEADAERIERFLYENQLSVKKNRGIFSHPSMPTASPVADYSIDSLHACNER